jgi:hypothetical protein
MFVRPLRCLGLVFSLSLALAACVGQPPAPRFPPVSFRNEAPFRIDVARIEIVPQYQAPAQLPHVEYDMPVSPENAIKSWVQDRLQPVGRTGTLRVLIRDAQATETPLKRDTGFTGMFKKEAAARIDMSMDVALQMLDERQFVTSEVTAKAARSRTELEDQTLNQRDKLLYDMVVDMTKGFDKDISPQISSTFGPWLGAAR